MAEYHFYHDEIRTAAKHNEEAIEALIENTDEIHKKYVDRTNNLDRDFEDSLANKLMNGMSHATNKVGELNENIAYELTNDNPFDEHDSVNEALNNCDDNVDAWSSKMSNYEGYIDEVLDAKYNGQTIDLYATKVKWGII